MEDSCPYTFHMRFDWDPHKAAANLRQHGVPFAEAVTVFSDDFALTREDPDAVGEQRFVTPGHERDGRAAGCGFHTSRARFIPADFRLECQQTAKEAV